jgi:hypothetical protein
VNEFDNGCDSFDAATPVSTIDGLKFIGELKTGDRVLARSEEMGSYAFERITQVFSHEDPVTNPRAGTWNRRSGAVLPW